MSGQVIDGPQCKKKMPIINEIEVEENVIERSDLISNC